MGGSRMETVRKKAWAKWRACRPTDGGLGRVPPVTGTLLPGWPSPIPRSLGKRPQRSRPPSPQPETPPPGGPLRSPHQGAWALGRGLGAAAPEAARPLPPLPPGPGWGSESRSPPGGASPPSRSLPPAHTKTTRADRGACGRAPQSSSAHTHARPQGRMESGVMDGGTRELRTSRPYLQARSCGREGRGAGGALPGPRPASRGPAAHGQRGVRGPSGRELALAASPPSVVHNLEGSCAPHWPSAAPVRLSRRPSAARSEPSPAQRAPRPLPLLPSARAARAFPAPPPPRARPPRPSQVPPPPRPPPSARACSAPAAAARCLRVAAVAAAGLPSLGAQRG